MAGEIDRKLRWATHRRAKLQHKSCLDGRKRGVFCCCCEHQTQRAVHTGWQAYREASTRVHTSSRALCCSRPRRDYFLCEVTTSETRALGARNVSERVRRADLPRRNSTPTQKIRRQRIFLGAASVPRNTSRTGPGMSNASGSDFLSNAARLETFGAFTSSSCGLKLFG